MIITTHNRLWYDWFIHVQKCTNTYANFVNLKVTNWSLEYGPTINDINGDYDKLLQDINEGEAHEHLIPTAGRLLEELLQGLRYSLKLSVPAKAEESYTIADIWPMFIATCKGKNNAKYKVIWRHIEEDCNNLNNSWIIRNWGTHYNEVAIELTKEEVMQFVDPLLKLYRKVRCQKCDRLIEEASVPKRTFSCRCGNLLYTKEEE